MRLSLATQRLASTLVVQAALHAAPRCVQLRAGAATDAWSWTDLSEEAARPTDAQLSRTVAAVSESGTLSTSLGVDGEAAIFSHHIGGFIADAAGCPQFPLHSKQAEDSLEVDRSATLLLRAPSGGAAAGSSVALVGELHELSVDDLSDAELSVVAQASGLDVQTVAGRPWRRLVPARVHLFDAVRDVEAWVPPAEYAGAEANPLSSAFGSLLQKINGQHAASLRRFAACYAGAEAVRSAEVLGVDQLGFDLRAEIEGAPPAQMRLGFKYPPANEEEGISVFMKLFQEAWEREREQQEEEQGAA